MRFELVADAEEFASRVWPYITERVARNMHGTLLVDVRAGRFPDGVLLALGLDDNDEVAWLGIRPPPHFLLTSDLDPGAVGELVDWWLGFDPELPGVDGPPESAGPISVAWAERTGGTARLKLSEAMHELERVTDPPHGTAPGHLRVATEADRELLIDWMLAFAEEAGLPAGDRERTARGVDLRLARDGLLIWEDDEPVSFLGISPEVAGVVRIGPVYTPPSLRGHGYASSAVAETSRRVLADGAERLMLFTDLTNPTSNKIYADVGFRRTGAWEMREFDRP
jgi:RimJ/RimL family protein N-acetyltransferase